MKTLTTVAAALLAAFLPLTQDPKPATGPASRPGDQATIFYAVLEGLYDEGVATADVEILLHQEPTTKQFSYFVYGCPLCMPAIDALQLYRGRPMFHGHKGESDTFGAGLPAKESAALRSDDVAARLRVLHDFVERCLQKKLASLRLLPAEREQWQLVLKEMRNKGGYMLKEAQQAGTAGALGAAKGCAVCDGANDAGSWMGR
ncbi:MAG: hypothetical protein WAT39_07390 [Planctomycetota bacterium]